MKKVLIVFLLIFVSFAVNAQWNCPSKQGSFTKPVFNTPLKGGIELMGSGGIIDDNYFGFFAEYGALEYEIKQHTFYLEGGFKTWSRHDDGLNQTYNNGFIGFREAYYQFLNK